MQVVHVAFECAPIYKTGGLGDVVGSLPIFQQELGISTVVVMPKYGWTQHPPKLPHSSVKVIYIENKWFIKHNVTHDPRIQAPKYAYFCYQVLEELKRRNMEPDIIHCHDWHAALIPMLLKKRPDPFFTRTKTLLTIHNIAYQGKFSLRLLEHPETRPVRMCFPQSEKKVIFLAEGIKHADFVSTVSPQHAKEIRSGKAAFGLSRLIRKKPGKFVGILNGIDYRIWTPKHDPLLARSYDRESVFTAKKINKTTLQKHLDLNINADIPLFGFIARLSAQKGIDLLLPLIAEFPSERLQLVILGTGDKKYETALRQFQKKVYTPWISVNLLFDEKLAHRIYASSDFFLIPSHYEPCGLTQMISMSYGTIPVATTVGGLVDTIEQGKTGFLAPKLTSDSFKKTLEKAVTLWEHKPNYQTMVTRIMRQDFSWKKSAQEYKELYSKLLKKV